MKATTQTSIAMRKLVARPFGQLSRASESREIGMAEFLQ
jgi:hypothetical protein